jgi:two-component system sensor histidine kinase DesK
VHWEPDSVRVEVSDDGGGPGVGGVRHLSTGSGLRGLAERVSAAGGKWESGLTPVSGFRVVATLPVAVGAL